MGREPRMRKMKKLTLVKLGGSLITDKTKPYTVRWDVLKRLAKEIAESWKSVKGKLIVGHGGGSFPHCSAKRYKVHLGVINEESYKGIVFVQNDASKLNRIVVEALIEAGVNAVSVQPSACLICENGRIKEWYLEPLKNMLNLGLLPVPFGDVCLDRKMGCCIVSTEEILYYLAKNLDVERIILVGKVDGVFTGVPEKDKNVKLIKEITPENFEEVKNFLGGSDGIDVTGGMLHKIERMLEIAEYGVVCEIINGLKENYLKRALLGETGLGTVIRN